MSRRPRVPGSRDPRQLRAALRGMDGGAQLRAALDEMRRRGPDDVEVVVVDNGGRGPAIIDTRGASGAWVEEGALPTGVIAALADLDDPSPATLLENGFDVVHLLEGRGRMDDAPVRMSVYFHPRLGLEPPPPFWVRFDRRRGGFVPVDEPEAA